MIGSPLLAFPDLLKDFLPETDISGEGLGAVLPHKSDNVVVHPTMYASRTLQPHEMNYGVTESEALCVVWAMSYFCSDLYIVMDMSCLHTMRP